MAMKRAVLFGATGLVGRALLQLLLDWQVRMRMNQGNYHS
jgi:uncharacterized protein YbjT (DUF2867 family)